MLVSVIEKKAESTKRKARIPNRELSERLPTL